MRLLKSRSTYRVKYFHFADSDHSVTSYFDHDVSTPDGSVTNVTFRVRISSINVHTPFCIREIVVAFAGIVLHDRDVEITQSFGCKASKNIQYDRGVNENSVLKIRIVKNHRRIRIIRNLRKIRIIRE